MGLLALKFGFLKAKYSVCLSKAKQNLKKQQVKEFIGLP
jgi:hypothetical protein